MCALALPITEAKPVLQVSLQFHSLHHFHKQPTVCNVKYDIYVLFLNNMKQQPLKMQHEHDQKNHWHLGKMEERGKVRWGNRSYTIDLILVVVYELNSEKETRGLSSQRSRSWY